MPNARESTCLDGTLEPRRIEGHWMPNARESARFRDARHG
ncbi:hypothetical protein HMPREF1155_0280 [Slackia sp. CM382]|nr:hypothetical protein HMPREF1155_0280 [Slackia sp. CM382]